MAMAEIIRKNTTWAAGSVIDLQRDVQIAAGVTLTIEPGVVVNGNGHQFYVVGNLEVGGTAAEKVKLNNVTVSLGTDFATPAHVGFSHVSMKNGSFLGTYGYGSFDIERSDFHQVSGFYIWYPTGPSTIDRSLFDHVASLRVGVDGRWGNSSLAVTNNTFVGQNNSGFYNKSMLEIWANYGDKIFIKGNNFYSEGNKILSIAEGSPDAHLPDFAANGNFFGTTKGSVIADLVLDSRDSLTRGTKIDFTGFLNEPNPLAPRYSGPTFQWGGKGDDIFIIDHRNDHIVEYKDRGIDTAIASVSYTLPKHVERLVLTGEANLSGTGNILDNYIEGNSGRNKLVGGDGHDVINGNAGNDTLDGGAGKDSLNGGAGDDVLKGGNSADSLTGGAGLDKLTGGAGADRFVFATGDFAGGGASTADRVTDFQHREGDRIDLSSVDANGADAGDGVFTFIGSAAFDKVSGQLRYQASATVTTLLGDIDGDGVADFAIRLDGKIALVAADFVL